MSVSPSHRNTVTRPTNRAVAGIISTTTQRATRNAPAERGSRAIAKPAHEATTTLTGTATAATISEFRRYRAIGTVENTSA